MVRIFGFAALLGCGRVGFEASRSAADAAGSAAAVDAAAIDAAAVDAAPFCGDQVCTTGEV